MLQIPGVPLKICEDVSTSVMQFVLTALSAALEFVLTLLRYKQTRSIHVSKHKRKCATLTKRSTTGFSILIFLEKH